MIIGIGHKARQGKDTFADFLQQELRASGKTCRVYSLAAPLKILARLFGMKSKDSEGLQALGYAIRRFDPDFFVKLLAPQIDDEAVDFALVTDIRFPNEAAWVKSSGGVTVKVQRLEDGGVLRATDRDAQHVSETALDGYEFDLIVSAHSGGMSTLRLRAAELAKKVVAEEYHD